MDGASRRRLILIRCGTDDGWMRGFESKVTATMITLETERTILRPWRDEDIPTWVAMCADARVMEFYTMPLARDEACAQVEGMRARMKRDGYGWWVLEIKDGASVAGVMVLQDVPFETHFTPAIEIGWRLVPEAWGKGYASESGAALLDFAFNELQRSQVVAVTSAINVRSRRVMERLGMVYDPDDDFEHPRIEVGHPLRRHVLYRKKKPTPIL